MADRHQFRAPWHSYDEGIFFVTICCKSRAHYFGIILADEMIYSALGQEIERRIKQIETIHADCEVWNYVVMPNHIHMVLSIVGTRRGASPSTSTNEGCLHPPLHGEPPACSHHNSRLSVIINHLKGHLTKYAAQHGLRFAWQSRFYEHIIRRQDSYRYIMDYIDNNIENWSKDCFY